MEKNIDHFSGLEIRRTDNGLRKYDLEAPQDPEPLKLDENGLPVGWEAPHDDRS